MSVIAELRVPSTGCEFGHLIDRACELQIELASMVTLENGSVPLLWVYDDPGGRFQNSVIDHASVKGVSRLERYPDRDLYALDWDSDADAFLDAVRSVDGDLVSAAGRGGYLYAEVRCPSHDALATLEEGLEATGMSVDIQRIHNPTSPDAGAWFGLTAPQREALLLAIEEGYYEIPRTCTTEDLAEELGISDQAVTERLRRATVNLVENTLLATGSERDE